MWLISHDIDGSLFRFMRRKFLGAEGFFIAGNEEEPGFI
jgi:hypothetical protein